MKSDMEPIPDGHGSIDPYPIIREAAKTIGFHKKAFGATEPMRPARPHGKLWA